MTPMAPSTPPDLMHHECRRIAMVLEGVAGTLHEGGPVEREDLREMAEIAEWVWRAGPKPTAARATDFESAHAAFVHSSDGCAVGMAHEASLVERAATRMATQLRRTAEESLRFANRKELPSAVDVGLTRLARSYAAHARSNGLRPE